jgi:hypothetical protein
MDAMAAIRARTSLVQPGDGLVEKIGTPVERGNAPFSRAK